MIFLDPKEEIIKQARYLKTLWDKDPGDAIPFEEMEEALTVMMAAVQELEEEEDSDLSDLVN